MLLVWHCDVVFQFAQVVQCVLAILLLAAVKQHQDDEHTLLADAKNKQQQQTKQEKHKQRKNKKNETQKENKNKQKNKQTTHTLRADRADLDLVLGNRYVL